MFDMTVVTDGIVEVHRGLSRVRFGRLEVNGQVEPVVLIDGGRYVPTAHVVEISEIPGPVSDEAAESVPSLLSQHPRPNVRDLYLRCHEAG